MPDSGRGNGTRRRASPRGVWNGFWGGPRNGCAGARVRQCVSGDGVGAGEATAAATARIPPRGLPRRHRRVVVGRPAAGGCRGGATREGCAPGGPGTRRTAMHRRLVGDEAGAGRRGPGCVGHSGIVPYAARSPAPRSGDTPKPGGNAVKDCREFENRGRLTKSSKPGLGSWLLIKTDQPDMPWQQYRLQREIFGS